MEKHEKLAFERELLILNLTPMRPPEKPKPRPKPPLIDKYLYYDRRKNTRL